MTYLKFGILPLLIILFSSTTAFAYEPIPITISSTMDKLVLDGKWTHPIEWKQSSLNEFVYDDQTKIILRTAHQGDFVYVFIDAISDYTLDKNADRAIICFDSKNNKSIKPDADDYCFISVLEGTNHSLQGGSPIAINGHFEKIHDHKNTVVLSSISDRNDRYSKTPHPSFEFKIPIDIIERNSVYGFYYQVFDANKNMVYEYPKNMYHISAIKISSPSEWGEVFSPDKSIPEFNLPILIMILSIGLITFFSKTKYLNNVLRN